MASFPADTIDIDAVEETKVSVSEPADDIGVFGRIDAVYRMRAFDTTLGRTVYWTSAVIDAGAVEYTGPGPVNNVIVSHVIGT